MTRKRDLDLLRDEMECRQSETQAELMAPDLKRGSKKALVGTDDLSRLGRPIMVEILRLSQIHSLTELCGLTESQLRDQIRPHATSYRGSISTDHSYQRVNSIVARLKTLGLSLREESAS